MNIELTVEQSRALATGNGSPLFVIDPQTQQSYRLVQADEYEKLLSHNYDDSPWTSSEMAALAGAAFNKLDDDDYSHYLQEKP